jgi:citrate synthase
MMFGVPAEPYEVDDEIVRVLEPAAHPPRRPRAELLDLDGAPRRQLEGQPLRLVAAGICALWGPLHGGANQEVSRCSRPSSTTAATSQKYVDLAKDKTRNFLLMGFGHRVYKNFDPAREDHQGRLRQGARQARHPRPAARPRAAPRGGALKDPYFVSRKLYPNVDFYSGIIYRALGSPRTCSR